MHMRAAFIPLSALSVLLTACGSDSSSSTATPSSASSPTSATIAVSIPFEAVSGSTPIACGTTLTGLGSAATSASVQDFRYYIHDVRLVKADGTSTPLTLDQNSHQFENVALIDHTGGACDASPGASLGSTVTGTIPNNGSSYSALRFTLGVPETLNHQNQVAMPSPLNLAKLWWSWAGGYKHATLEVKPVGGITRPADPAFTATTFNIHLGSTSCRNSTATGTGSCAKNNRPVIVLNSFTPNTGKVRLDYATLVSDSKLTEDNGGPAGCMSGGTDPECPKIFEKLGLDLSTGSLGSVSQTSFSLVP